MLNQKLSFYSGCPVLIMPNAASKLKEAELDGKPESFTTKRGHNVNISGLNPDYHLYIMASRISSSFAPDIKWNAKEKKIECNIVFHTYPYHKFVKAEILLDGSSPYPLPAILNIEDVVSVEAVQWEEFGYPIGLKFTYNNSSSHSFFLNPDLLHFTRFVDDIPLLTDFHIEYIGIACGKNGNSNVFKRANAHEKAVEIQADLIQKHTNRSLYIFAYDPGILVQSKVPGLAMLTSHEMLKELVDGGDNSLYEAMEASLIAYFQPTYNKEFTKFPANKPHWLTKKFNSLNGTVLNIDEIEVNLWSDASQMLSSSWEFGRFSSHQQLARASHYINYSSL